MDPPQQLRNKTAFTATLSLSRALRVYSASVRTGRRAVSSCAFWNPSRRAALQTLLVMPLVLTPEIFALASPIAEQLELYVDEASGFSVLRPASWPRDAAVNLGPSAAFAGAGSAVAFADPNNTVKNMSVLARPVVGTGADLRAFGSPSAFGRRLVRSVAGGDIDSARTARLLRARARNSAASGTGEMYEVEYIVASSKWIRRNLCVVGLGNNFLYTLNMQAPAAQWGELQKPFRKIAESFRIVSRLDHP